MHRVFSYFNIQYCNCAGCVSSNLRCELLPPNPPPLAVQPPPVPEYAPLPPHLPLAPEAPPPPSPASGNSTCAVYLTVTKARGAFPESDCPRLINDLNILFLESPPPVSHPTIAAVTWLTD